MIKTMNYEKKYKELVEKIQTAKEKSGGYTFTSVIDGIFHELKESEDERIRKEIVRFLDAINTDSAENRRFIADRYGDAIPDDMIPGWIAWLEKQGEQKLFNNDKYQTVSVKILDRLYESEKELERLKQGEQKSEEVDNLHNYLYSEQKPTDKVEPKFKVGDWIVNTTNNIYKVLCIIDDEYRLSHNIDGNVVCAKTETIDKKCHLWTIQDAKEGDVIFSNDGHGSDSIELIKSIYDECINFWFCLSSKNNFKDYYYEVYNGNIPRTNFASRKNATPATKEQRDLLFAKMKEAGYEWNAEKKELEKIEQKPVSNTLKEAFDKSKKDYSLEEKKEASDYSESIIPTSIACGESEEEYLLHKIIEAAFIAGQNSKQKPAWSEEDERHMNTVVDVVHGGTHLAYENELDWLKSLKDRVQPQPKQEWSEEDENAIGTAIIALEDLYDEDSPDTTYGGYNLPFDKAAERLKSLKERYTWKPSNEQMEALWDSIPENVKEISEREMLLDSLYQDLKKLRKE